MPWLIASFPWLVYLLAAWLVSGLFVARGLLRLRDGLEVACLALPLGLVSHLLVANALGYVMFLPFALWWTALAGLAGGGWWLAGRARCEPLAWDLSPRRRRALLASGVTLALGLLAFNLSENFTDDGGHGTIAHLLASGQFPLRFPCNPSLRAGYHYGSDLLAAQAMVVAGLRPLEGVDLVKSLVAACVAALAFATGRRPRRQVGAGLLAVLLLFTAGPMLWIYLPFSGGGLAQWALAHPGLSALPGDMAKLVSTPWNYTVVTPGFVTPSFAHAHRTASWAFAPFQGLLVLALLEAPLDRRRRTLALALGLAATGLLQTGALPMLVAGLGALALWRARSASTTAWREAASLPTALALAAVLMAVQGGPVTDSLLDRLAGAVNPSTDFRFGPPLLPSCRDARPDLHCALLSFANLGFVPWLVPWLALFLWRRGPRPRLALLAGCLASYVQPFFFRYGHFDWSIQRLNTFATWLLAVLLAAPLFELLAGGGKRRVLALILLLVSSWGGLTELGMVLGGRWARDSVGRERWQVGPADDELERLAPRLPLQALVFDPAGFSDGFTCRAGLVLGRYAAAASTPAALDAPTPAFAAIREKPEAERLRAAGFTHVYLDTRWWQALSPEGRAALRDGPFELLGRAGARQDFRALLRVCRPEEGCRLQLPGSFD